MAKDTLEMGSVETLELPPEENNDTPEPNSEENAQSVDDSSTDSAEDSSPEPASFLDAMKKAMDGEDIDPKEAKGEDPQPEPEPEPEPEPTDTKQSRSSSDFKKIKTERDNAKRELDELKAKLENLENSDVDNVLESLTKERDDLSQRLQLAAIERHPKFQQEYESKISGIVERAKKLVGAEQGDRVADLLTMRDSDYRSNALEEVMLELPTAKQAQLGAMLASVEEVRAARENALTNSEETYQKLMADQASQREAALAETNKTFDTVLGEAGHLEIFQTRDDDEGWNNEVSERVNLARNIFSGENEPQELARASLWAAAGPAYRELLASQIELNRRLRQQLKEQSGATPAVASGTGNKGASEPKSFIDTMDELMNG